MLPIELTIEGLYSYKTAQTINFEQLTSNQLFGIFGEVGSGKSAILEAMMFALFGDTDRLKKSGESRNYNMMNLQSDRMMIDFICWAGKESKQKYRFIYESRRNSKRFEDVKPKDRRILQEIDGEWQAIENANTEQIIGMNYQNFRQTIIIPQGKFRDFIEQTAGDRTKMLQELFQLDRFDLSDKVSQLSRSNNDDIQHLSGKYSTLLGFTKERGEEFEQQQKLFIEAKSKLETQLFSDLAKRQTLEALQTQIQELANAQTNLAKLETQKPQFEQRIQQLQQYRKAFEQFSSKLERQVEIQQEISQQQKALQNSQAQLLKLKEAFSISQTELATAQSEYEKRDSIRQQCEDLGQIVSIKRFTTNLETTQESWGKSQQVVAKSQEALTLFQTKLAEEEANLAKLKEQSTDISLLKNWEFLRIQEAEKSKLLSEAKNKLAIAQLAVEKEKESLDGLVQKLELSLEIAKLSDFKKLFEHLESKKQVIEVKLEHAENQIAKLRTRTEISHLAQNLADGEPCPLCGALEHPDTANSLEMDGEMKLAKSEKTRLKEVLKNLLEYKNTVQKIELQQKQAETQLAEKKADTDKLQAEVLEIVGKSERIPISLVEIQQQLSAFEMQKMAIQKSEKQITILRKEVEGARSQIEKEREKRQELENQKVALETKLQTARESIKVFGNEQVEKFLGYSFGQLDSNLKKGEEKHQNLHLNLQNTQQKNQLAESQLNAKTGQAKAEEKQLKDGLSKQEVLEKETEKLLVKSDFPDLEAVQKLITLKLNTEKEQADIQDFKESLSLVNAKVLELKEKIGQQVWQPDALARLQAQIAQSEEEKEALNKKLVGLQKDLAENQQKLVEKSKMQQALKELEERQENLSTLRKLFHSKGFVQYVSSVYLQNLVAVANQRFSKMTQNKLSLQLNEQDDFIVQDALNGGKTRLLKTLSGGQTFQAALCLALALAENVKSLNQSEQSFFFLDEGFGTLDGNSLKVVFETLKNLKQENRIVGVISHVEELKQEIEVSLNIKNDEEKGSLIQYSWEA